MAQIEILPTELPEHERIWLRVDYYQRSPEMVHGKWTTGAPSHWERSLSFLVYTDKLRIYNAAGLVIYIHKDLLR